MEKIDDTKVRIERDEEIDFEQLKMDLPATIVMELVSPKDLKGGPTTELEFQEATGRHIDQINKAGTERAQYQVSMRVIADCCGIGPDEIELLGGRDISRLSEVLGYFLGSDSPQTAQPRQ